MGVSRNFCRGGEIFFDKNSVKQRFYSISLTLFKTLPLKTDTIFNDHIRMKTALLIERKKKQQSRLLPTDAALIGIVIVECYSAVCYLVQRA